ncbi:hypothetical protein CEH05_03300 [Halobacillus halophilus]|uniref:Uncharacterized protein n=1 Tax=Halobacillus halophilus (strain ATCC 35676 / DSM 2266 / JCM 20832 / KCTC 3685 / LMG 17431 / NBRC 102448 / NCIMB 2269) TaxID=866895 RepID=I0JIN7_HALH3|nr:hypothetical protein [Halobacillus halophilus]ASF38187.1 hypothetical protein CEH05_03300 [Halobacillus halophilus]CCG44005.1 conserved hypothetical protein [Halobacillus halophilus DSM 2266]
MPGREKGKARFIEESEEQQALFDERAKRRKKYKTPKARKKKREAVKASMADILPIQDMTSDGSFELQENKGYMDVMQLQSKDIYSPSTQETEYDIMMMAKFFQSYAHDIKVVSMNFPVDMQKQLDAIHRKIAQNTAPLYERFLLKKRDELQFLETHRTNREFYLYIYASSLKQLSEYRNNCRRYLGRVTPIIELTDEKKLDLIYKLNNLNTKLEKRG